MFGIGGLSPISLLATAALGPAGGIVAQLAQQVFSSMAQAVISQMGQQMGLPQDSVDFAQTAFAAGAGGSFQGVMGQQPSVEQSLQNLGSALGASPREIGDAQRSANDLILKTAADAMETDEAKDAKAGGGKSGGGWLRAIARAMGEAADKTADKLEKDARGLDNAKPSESAEYSADAQAFSMLMNSINTAIKSIGEALGTMARKQ